MINIGIFTIGVLFKITLGNNRVGNRGICLVAFNVDTNKAILIERDSEHPFEFGVMVKGHSDFPPSRVQNLIFLPLWGVATDSPGACNATHDGTKATF